MAVVQLSRSLIGQLIAPTAALIVAYWVGRGIYNIKFHRLSKYPGPKLAAISDLWWAYACMSGKYPWLIEDVLTKYGLTEVSKQTDIYLAQDKSLETFVQVGYDALDTGDGGISGEANPSRHREVAKKLAPAFSARNFKAKEATIHKHLDLFVERMKELGGTNKPVEMQRWSDWLALDLSADLTYGRDMGQVRDIWPAMPFLIKMNSQIVQDRIGRRGELDHLDYFEQLIPSDTGTPVPDDKKHIFHLENVAGQLLLASWQPLANQFYSLMFFLLREPGLHAYEALVEEVRTGFEDYESIDTEKLCTAKFRYLQACVSESLRIHQETIDGLPRISPGAVVDGEYITKGVTCQISYFAAVSHVLGEATVLGSLQACAEVKVMGGSVLAP
ncbi:cytochrome P450 [Diaporthe sp. PMI_573]|nr:cytochrome P450 [Diaporthaceae sp. PMI_573]